jgi:hypothetical protein
LFGEKLLGKAVDDIQTISRLYLLALFIRSKGFFNFNSIFISHPF